FQAEDGIRDFHVTGVQTCALPISCPQDHAPDHGPAPKAHFRANRHADRRPRCEDPAGEDVQGLLALAAPHDGHAGAADRGAALRSEERRVGKEWRSRWSAYDWRGE